MLQKVCAFIVCAGFIGYAFAEDDVQQVVTSEVFYSAEEYQVPQQEVVPEYNEVEEVATVPEVETVPQEEVPVWPLSGSEADVEVACSGVGCPNSETKLVSKIGSGLVIENNIVNGGTGWSGGPNISNGIQIPAGFDYECANDAEMPLMRREMMEDDGGSVLAMSRSSHKNCNKTADSYASFAQRAGFAAEKTCNALPTSADGENYDAELAVNDYVDEEAPRNVKDQVRSWVVADGQTLRKVLQSWCDKEGWDLVWATSLEYPIEASAVFKGRFVDVAAALIRNFERATPIPYAKFYKGNRVIVVSTAEE